MQILKSLTGHYFFTNLEAGTMEDKIDGTIKCSMEKIQESSQVGMGSTCYATMVKKAAATLFTPMI